MNRTTNKRITLSDLSQVFIAASLPYFGGGTRQYKDASGNLPAGCYAYQMLFYVVGVDDDKAMIKWRVQRSGDGSGYDITNNINVGMISFTSGDRHTTVNRLFNTPLDPQQVHPNLKHIKKDEVKILYEFGLWTSRKVKVNGKLIFKDASASRSVFGFWFLTPKLIFDYGDHHCFFNEVVVFTPKPGLFSETKP
jgi:hypothetical protein